MDSLSCITSQDMKECLLIACENHTAVCQCTRGLQGLMELQVELTVKTPAGDCVQDITSSLDVSRR